MIAKISLSQALDEHLVKPANSWMRPFKDYMIMSADADAYALFGESKSGYRFVREVALPSGVRAIKDSIADKDEANRLLVLRQVHKLNEFQRVGMNIKGAIEEDALLAHTQNGETVELSIAACNILSVLTGREPSPARELAFNGAPELN